MSIEQQELDEIRIRETLLQIVDELSLSKNLQKSSKEQNEADSSEAELIIEEARKSKSDKLDLSGLSLEKIPTTILHLELTSLNLAGNFISDAAPLAKLQNLTELDLSSNRIANIASLAGLQKLTRLNLSVNQIEDTVPLARLQKLKELYLGANRISDASSLSNIKSLQTLDLQLNKLQDAQSLQNLLESLSHLTVGLEIRSADITLDGNPLPQEMLIAVHKGQSALLDYFARLKAEIRQEDQELKVIFIGNSQTGKTTLREMIRSGLPPKPQHSTHGLEILRKNFKIKGADYFLNLFDFGGQEYYHDTHHFFFTHQSLYILLWDSAKNFYQAEHRRDDKLPSEQFPIEYWLGAVEYFTKRSYENDPDAEEDRTRLLLIHNSFSEEMSPKEFLTIDESLNAKIDSSLDVKLNPKKPRRCGIIQQVLEDIVPGLVENNTDKIFEGHQRIRERVLDGVGLTEDGRDDLPWFVPKFQLKGWFAEEKFDHETNENLYGALAQLSVKGIAQTAEIQPQDKAKRKKQYVIFRPKELAKHIYSVLEASVGKKVGDLEPGEFDYAHIQKTLKEETKEVRELVEHFMLEQKIVFKKEVRFQKNKKWVDEIRYVAPQYLSQQPRPTVELFRPGYKKSRYRYNYEGFLHRNIIIRIFSRLSVHFKEIQESGKPKYAYWRNGFVLSRKNQAGQFENLMVELNREQNLLEFYQFEQGTRPSELLKLVFQTVDELNHREGFVAFNPERKPEVRMLKGELSKTISEAAKEADFHLPNFFDWENHFEKQGFVNLEVSPNGKHYIPLWWLKEKAEKQIHIFEYPIITKTEKGEWKKRERRFELGDFQSVLKEVLPEQYFMKRAFISYSSKDEKYRQELETHLMGLQRRGLLSTWDDRKLEVGENWDDRIQDELQKADVILLLISSDFIATEYIWREEMSKALERHKKNDDVVVVPIMIRHCNFNGLPFAELNMPNKAKPIAAWPDRDEGWMIVSQALERAIREPRVFKLDSEENNQEES